MLCAYNIGKFVHVTNITYTSLYEDSTNHDYFTMFQSEAYPLSDANKVLYGCDGSSSPLFVTMGGVGIHDSRDVVPPLFETLENGIYMFQKILKKIPMYPTNVLNLVFKYVILCATHK